MNETYCYAVGFYFTTESGDTRGPFKSMQNLIDYKECYFQDHRVTVFEFKEVIVLGPSRDKRLDCTLHCDYRKVVFTNGEVRIRPHDIGGDRFILFKECDVNRYLDHQFHGSDTIQSVLDHLNRNCGSWTARFI